MVYRAYRKVRGGYAKYAERIKNKDVGLDVAFNSFDCDFWLYFVDVSIGIIAFDRPVNGATLR
jgi:hypothetical protein